VSLYRLAQAAMLTRMFYKREHRHPVTPQELAKWAYHHGLVKSRLKPTEKDFTMVMSQQ